MLKKKKKMEKTTFECEHLEKRVRERKGKIIIMIMTVYRKFFTYEQNKCTTAFETDKTT